MTQWPLYKLFRLPVVLLMVSLFTFYLCKSTPGTPATLQIAELKNTSRSRVSAKRWEVIYQAFQQQSNLNKPLFYFELGTWASSDTLYKVCKAEHLPMVERWIATYGNWTEIQAYYQAIGAMEEKATSFPAALPITQKLYRASSLKEALLLIKQLQTRTYPADINKSATNMLLLLEKIEQQATPYKAYLPALYWHGTDNMYHQFMKNIFSGDFGYSLQKHRPVIELIETSLKWSLITGLSSLLLTYLLAIPLGVYAATHPQALLSRFTNTLFHAAYALPSYWVATMLIIFVASDEYLGLFPAFGTGDVESDASWQEKISVTAYHLVLPVFCWTYGSVAYLSRQVQASMKEELSKEYILTARAKGLSEHRIIWRHAFRNAMLPMVTLLGLVLPGLITGAVIVENIFSIPGMGKLVIESLQTRDYPVLYMITLLTAVVSVLGLYTSDLLTSRFFPSFNPDHQV